MRQFENPYPGYYRPAFASSGIPYPLVHRFTLAGDLPPSLWKQWGLPRSARVPFLERLGPAYPPVAPHLREVSEWHSYLTTCLLAQASQPLWLVVRDDGSTAVHLS